MRNSELKRIFKAEADSIRPDFNAMLERINAEPVERERVVNTGETSGISTAPSNKKARRASWRNSGDERVVPKSRLAVGAASFCCALMLTVASIFAIGYFSKTDMPSIITVGADTYVSLNINPGVDFTVNKYNKITSAVATNSGGVLLITKLCDTLGVETLVGRELNDAMVDVIDTAAKMGYIDVNAVGISNALMISVIAENNASAGTIKNDLAQESKKYFADNGIYAVVVTEYDNKKALVEEARKNNPELTEDSSVGDLISSVEKNNADKSALQAEIEAARQNYEAYLRKTFVENKDKAINKEISTTNNDIARLERLISSLNDMLEEKTDGIGADDITNTSSDNDAVIEAIKKEIEEKTAAYNEKKNHLNTEKNNTEIAIANTKNNIEKLTAEIADSTLAIASLEQKIIDLTAENAQNNDELVATREKLASIKESFSGTTKVLNFLKGQEKWLEAFEDRGVGYEKHVRLIGAIIDNAIFYDIMLDPELSKGTAELTAAAAKVCLELFGGEVTSPSDNEMINSIIAEFGKQGLLSFDERFVTGTNAILETLGLTSTVAINQASVLQARENLAGTERLIIKEIEKIETAIKDNENSVVELNKNIESLNEKINSLDSDIDTAEKEIEVWSITIDNIVADLVKCDNDYTNFIKSQIDKANKQLDKAVIKRDSLRRFRDNYKQGDRLPGHDSLNAEISVLEEKLASDIAKNDAEALAESLEIDIKNQADELFNENVNKFNEHDRQFTAEEYDAWEREQKELVKDLSWEEIYSAWLENQA